MDMNDEIMEMLDEAPIQEVLEYIVSRKDLPEHVREVMKLVVTLTKISP